MDNKLKPSRFKVKIIAFIFVIAISLILFSCASYRVIETDSSTDINPFIKEFITNHAAQIGESEQLIFATNRDTSSFHVTIRAIERNDGVWRLVFPAFTGLIGEKGFAAIGEKREGDGKSPSGVFPLGIAFGYEPLIVTKMDYRQATDDDFWVDDVDSEDYNKWIKGKPRAASLEKMKRDDEQHKYRVVIEYNMHPIMSGKGSAIFLHLWKPGESTHGCVSVSEEMILKILEWLDPDKKPLIIMGTESELGVMGSAFRIWAETKAEASARPAGDVKAIILGHRGFLNRSARPSRSAEGGAASSRPVEV
jgi:L,D-peptidoglycan transpeptidase YkuD (ErfK/YbiS/YcfS/YnhG family)